MILVGPESYPSQGASQLEELLIGRIPAPARDLADDLAEERVFAAVLDE